MEATLRRLTYAAVTPARDEAHNLERLAASLLAQTSAPVRWVIVENGSSDGTPELARRLASEHEWIRVVHTESGERYDRTSPYMRAWHAGVEALQGLGDLVVKLDADVSFEQDFFAGVVEAFEADAELGIASGTLLEEFRGEWREWALLGGHCWGPTRTYRRACLEAVLPLDDGVGYAAIDETKAHLAGFSTRTLRHLPFKHHRPEGAGEGGRWRNWLVQGEAAHYTGCRPTYVLARSLYRGRADPAALALLAGYASCVVKRRRRCGDSRVVQALRRDQRWRNAFELVRSRSAAATD